MGPGTQIGRNHAAYEAVIIEDIFTSSITGIH